MAHPEGLEKLLDEGIIDEVHSRLLTGKEASVFIVERREEIIAAKVYKSREQRTFRATAAYTEGRNQTRNSRDRRAMQRRSSYGRQLMEDNWRDMEFRALSEAFHAGVRVPEPILLYEDVLLMELLVDESGAPAPRLADFELTPEVAELLHREVYGQVRLLLASGKVHGDLSAFNILISDRGVTLIDLPQVVDAAGNNQAADILRRDLANVTEHLARFHPPLGALADCGAALWRHYERGTLDTAMEPEPGPARGPRGRGRRAPGTQAPPRPGGRPERTAAADRSRTERSRTERPQGGRGAPDRSRGHREDAGVRPERTGAAERSSRERSPPGRGRLGREQPGREQPGREPPAADAPGGRSGRGKRGPGPRPGRAGAPERVGRPERDPTEPDRPRSPRSPDRRAPADPL